MSMSSKGIKFKDHDGNGVYPCPYYPIGSIYLSVTNVNPSNFFGGTWEQIKDMFLLACGDTYANGTTGGEATHKLTVAEMPSHYHNMGTLWGQKSGYGRVTGGNASTGADRCNIQSSNISSGGNQAHNNMPPYLAVYVWKRTS